LLSPASQRSIEPGKKRRQKIALVRCGLEETIIFLFFLLHRIPFGSTPASLLLFILETLFLFTFFIYFCFLLCVIVLLRIPSPNYISPYASLHRSLLPSPPTLELVALPSPLLCTEYRSPPLRLSCLKTVPAPVLLLVFDSIREKKDFTYISWNNYLKLICPWECDQTMIYLY
jgi:hypothetical protein